jgi:hypothetical protein
MILSQLNRKVGMEWDRLSKKKSSLILKGEIVRTEQTYIYLRLE